jgi:hypothetical protein
MALALLLGSVADHTGSALSSETRLPEEIEEMVTLTKQKMLSQVCMWKRITLIYYNCLVMAILVGMSACNGEYPFPSSSKQSRRRNGGTMSLSFKKANM